MIDVLITIALGMVGGTLFITVREWLRRRSTKYPAGWTLEHWTEKLTPEERRRRYELLFGEWHDLERERESLERKGKDAQITGLPES